MPRSRYASNAKQLNQQLFLSLTDTLSVTQKFTSTIQLFGYQHSTLLNQIITTHAAVIGFKSFSNSCSPLQYVISRIGTINHTILSDDSRQLLSLFQATTTYGHTEHRRRE